MNRENRDSYNQKYGADCILTLAWDPDYTKLTPEEAKSVEAAEKSGFVDDSDIDWSQIGI